MYLISRDPLSLKLTANPDRAAKHRIVTVPLISVKHVWTGRIANCSQYPMVRFKCLDPLIKEHYLHPHVT